MFAFTDYTRLENFAILVGSNSDWRLNQHCYSQLPPVPQAQTVEYPCEKTRFGHLVSINKTAKGPWYNHMLSLDEVEVFGYKSGRVRLVE